MVVNRGWEEEMEFFCLISIVLVWGDRKVWKVVSDYG